MSDGFFPLGRDVFSRDLFLTSLRSWDDWPGQLQLPSQHFCLLVVGDARGVSDEPLGRFAIIVLDRGCVYVCAWGPDCERVEASFDREWAHRASATDPPVVLTVSHPDEALDEALDFITEVAWPNDAFAATCRSGLVVVVGNPDWAGWIRRRFQG